LVFVVKMDTVLCEVKITIYIYPNLRVYFLTLILSVHQSLRHE